MKNKFIMLFSLLLIASLALAACGGGESAATAVPDAPATAVSDGGNSGGSSAATGALALDPANASGDKSLAAVGYMYEGLVRADNGNAVSALAETFSISDDGLDYIFNLRPGVTFHDGTALNADVVVANFNRWFDAKDANRGSGAYAAWAANFNGFKGETGDDGKPKSQYDGIEKVNDYTVLVHLNTPDADFLTKLTNPAFSIMSPAMFASGADGGSGAYQASGADDSKVTLEPFAGYWDAAAVPSAGMDAPLK